MGRFMMPESTALGTLDGLEPDGKEVHRAEEGRTDAERVEASRPDAALEEDARGTVARSCCLYWMKRKTRIRTAKKTKSTMMRQLFHS